MFMLPKPKHGAERGDRQYEDRQRDMEQRAEQNRQTMLANGYTQLQPRVSSSDAPPAYHEVFDPNATAATNYSRPLPLNDHKEPLDTAYDTSDTDADSALDSDTDSLDSLPELLTGHLPNPIILPSARPSSSSKSFTGFTPSYAPILQHYGLTQSAFLTGLRHLNTSLASPSSAREHPVLTLPTSAPDSKAKYIDLLQAALPKIEKQSAKKFGWDGSQIGGCYAEIVRLDGSVREARYEMRDLWQIHSFPDGRGVVDVAGVAVVEPGAGTGDGAALKLRRRAEKAEMKRAKRESKREWKGERGALKNGERDERVDGGASREAREAGKAARKAEKEALKEEKRRAKKAYKSERRESRTAGRDRERRVMDAEKPVITRLREGRLYLVVIKVPSEPGNHVRNGH